MSFAFTLGGPFFLGVLCAGTAWRVQSKRFRVFLGVLFALPMVTMWQGTMMQVGGEPTVLSVIWAVMWSSPLWLAGILLCAWAVPSNGNPEDDWRDQHRDERRD